MQLKRFLVLILSSPVWATVTVTSTRDYRIATPKVVLVSPMIKLTRLLVQLEMVEMDHQVHQMSQVLLAKPQQLLVVIFMDLLSSVLMDKVERALLFLLLQIQKMLPVNTLVVMHMKLILSV